jgi:CheY-like chemotaxis protein
MRRYVASLLTRYCDVHTVADGAKALAELQERRMDYDLILSDDMMPNMTVSFWLMVIFVVSLICLIRQGSELLDAIRADATLRTIPFIMISAKAGDEARMGGLARGADDYLSKPFKAKELLLRVHTQLQSASVRNELETRMTAHLRSLEESRESFTRLCERLQVGIHRSDPSGALTWVNRKWSRTMGLGQDELHRWGEAIHPEDLPRTAESYRGTIASKIGYTEPLELRVRDVTLNGTYIDVSGATRNFLFSSTGSKS